MKNFQISNRRNGNLHYFLNLGKYGACGKKEEEENFNILVIFPESNPNQLKENEENCAGRGGGGEEKNRNKDVFKGTSVQKHIKVRNQFDIILIIVHKIS